MEICPFLNPILRFFVCYNYMEDGCSSLAFLRFDLMDIL